VVAANMLVAIVTAHLARGFWSSAGGYEFALLILSASLALSLTGPGGYSLDAAAGLTLPEPVTWIVVAVVCFGGAAGTLLSRRVRRRRLELG